jgi:hypothetical protein
MVFLLAGVSKQAYFSANRLPAPDGAGFGQHRQTR